MFFDFYLERDLLIRKKKLRPVRKLDAGNIENLKILFSGCFEEIKGKKCPFPNIRVHAVDTRRVLSASKSTFYQLLIYNLTYNLQRLIDNFHQYSQQKFHLQIKTESLHPVPKNPDGSYNINALLEFFVIDEKSIIVKEINRINDAKFNHEKNIKESLFKKFAHVQKKIINWYVNEAEPLFYRLEQFIASSELEFGHNKLDVLKKLYYDFRWLLNGLVRIEFKIMDLYTLARIFHEFKPKTRKEETKNFPKYPTNILYYAGAAHTEYTLKILKQFGFQHLYTSGTLDIHHDYAACIKVPSFEILQNILIPQSKSSI